MPDITDHDGGQLPAAQKKAWRRGPLALAALVGASLTLAVIGTTDTLQDGNILAWVTFIASALLVPVAFRELYVASKGFVDGTSLAFQACNEGLAVCSAAFSFISVVVITVLLWQGELQQGGVAGGDAARHTARLFWLSAMLAALGSSFFCLRRLGEHFGTPDWTARQAEDRDRLASTPSDAPPSPEGTTDPGSSSGQRSEDGGGSGNPGTEEDEEDSTTEPPASGHASSEGANGRGQQDGESSAERPPTRRPEPAGAPEQRPSDVPRSTPPPENPACTSFVVSSFWTGLLYRVAQAEVYTIILFFLVWGNAFEGGARMPETNGSPPMGNKILENISLLPVFALFVGLFIRSAEQLIKGLAERLFEVAQALFPTQKG